MFFMTRRSFASILIALCLTLALSASLAPGAMADGIYSDVPSGHWAYGEIQQATAAGLFTGYPDGTFGLGKSLTRSEFAVALCRFFSWEPADVTTSSFSDCTNEFYIPYIEALLTHGAVDAGGTFRPTAPITRGEMAEMMVRGLGYQSLAKAAVEKQEKNPFTDVSYSDADAGYILVAYTLGILQGNGNGTFRPDGTATREQAAALLVRTYQRFTSSLDWIHGFYALSSYSKIDLTAGMDAVSVGWSRLEVGKDGVPYLLTERTGDNSWAVPDGFELATGYFAEHGTPCNLSFFTSTYDSLTLSDGTETNDLAAALSTEERRTQAAQAIAQGAVDYAGVTIDFEGLRDRDGIKDAFVDFLQQLRSMMKNDQVLYVCVSDDTWYDGYDYRAIGEVADKVILMAHDYDFTIPDYYVGRDALDNSNPSAGLTDVYGALVALTDPDTGLQDLSKAALAVSIDSSGYQVDEDGKIASTDRFAPSPSTLVKRLQQQSAVIGWDDMDKVPYVTYSIEDGTRYTIWYEDARSVTEKIRLARMFGIDGVSLWYVGSIPTYEEEGLHYNVWQAVLDQKAG